jgi:hypothetical protein
MVIPIGFQAQERHETPAHGIGGASCRCGCGTVSVLPKKRCLVHGFPLQFTGERGEKSER